MNFLYFLGLSPLHVVDLRETRLIASWTQHDSIVFTCWLLTQPERPFSLPYCVFISIIYFEKITLIEDNSRKQEWRGTYWESTGHNRGAQGGGGSAPEQHMLGLVSHWLRVLGGPLWSNRTHLDECLLKTRIEGKKLCPSTYSSPEFWRGILIIVQMDEEWVESNPHNFSSV